MVCVTAAVLHIYELNAPAFNTVEPPGQIVNVPVIDGVGFAFTFIVLSDVAAEHPVPKFDVNLSVTVPLKFAAGV